MTSVCFPSLAPLSLVSSLMSESAASLLPSPQWSTWRPITIPPLPWRTRCWAVPCVLMTISWVAWSSSRTSPNPSAMMLLAHLVSQNTNPPATALMGPPSSVKLSVISFCLQSYSQTMSGLLSRSGFTMSQHLSVISLPFLLLSNQESFSLAP